MILNIYTQSADKGYRVYDRDMKDDIGDSSISIRDLDGSLTGRDTLVTVVKQDMYFADQDKCENMEEENLAICAETYIKFHIHWPQMEESDASFLTHMNGDVYYQNENPRNHVF